ncbi:type I-B CRISPR-associated endonuclease Cas1b [Stygiolobus caldivivus]|uniref:CRISPR-associated endonuclease Cas1 n=1 Tax=Stygiolobus caldivivus TaxID=2824673 RepID=A0A8D5U6R1_9CREN|nr:type I-B CRISPR-associated endonuclease Cas1b [Stygiolobus caldivivus]BCU70085.1 subtype I-B CRISPR-associated endonuclease Cas1 [Stygiolobus caldivivus]
MPKRLFLTTPGALKRKNNTIALVTKEGTKYAPINDVKAIYVFSEVRLNRRFLDFMAKNGIVVHFFSKRRRYVGSFIPKQPHMSGLVLVKQVEAYLDPGKRLHLAKRFVEGSIRNMSLVLRENKVDNSALKSSLERLEGAKSVEEAMGVEGSAREEYYRGLDVILKGGLGKRSKRPPENWVNSLISLGNMMLYTEVLGAIYQTQLDPRVGYLHTTNMRKFSLNLDIADVFKPIIVDRLVIAMINRKEVSEGDFEVKGLKLKDEGLRKFVKKFDEKMESKVKVGKRKARYSTLLRMEAYKVEKYVLGDEDYKPFVGR